MAKDKSRGKDKGKVKKKKAQARDKKRPETLKVTGLYDRPRHVQSVTTPTILPSAPQAPPTGG